MQCLVSVVLTLETSNVRWAPARSSTLTPATLSMRHLQVTFVFGVTATCQIQIQIYENRSPEAKNLDIQDNSGNGNNGREISEIL